MRGLMPETEAFDESALSRITTRIARECGNGPVSVACQETFWALSRYWGLLADGNSQSFGDEIHAAGVQFEASLVTVEAELCRSPSDGRAKCMTVELLGVLFPRDDDRIVRLRIALIQEMARFYQLDVPLSGTAMVPPTCSCHVDTPVWASGSSQEDIQSAPDREPIRS